MTSPSTGFIRVPKTHPQYAQRWYINPATGQTITRRAHQTLAKGGIKPEEVAKMRETAGVKAKSSRYNSFVKAYKMRTAIKTGRRPSDVKVRGNSAEAVIFKGRLARLREIGKDKNVDRSPRGELARLLVDLNMREAEFDRPVGES